MGKDLKSRTFCERTSFRAAHYIIAPTLKSQPQRNAGHWRAFKREISIETEPHQSRRAARETTAPAALPPHPGPENLLRLFCFSRRNAVSQTIVASEPVTDRLGPRSTPIRMAPVMSAETRGLMRRAGGDKARGQVVDEIVGEGDDAPCRRQRRTWGLRRAFSSRQASRSRRSGRAPRPMKRPATAAARPRKSRDQRQRACALDRQHQRVRGARDQGRRAES